MPAAKAWLPACMPRSVSTFAALGMLERRHRGLWAAYYNGGNIPIGAYLPVHKLPWVFTYNSWSPLYNYMLKAAVRCAGTQCLSWLRHSCCMHACICHGGMPLPGASARAAQAALQRSCSLPRGARVLNVTLCLCALQVGDDARHAQGVLHL